MFGVMRKNTHLHFNTKTFKHIFDIVCGIDKTGITFLACLVYRGDNHYLSC